MSAAVTFLASGLMGERMMSAASQLESGREGPVLAYRACPGRGRCRGPAGRASPRWASPDTEAGSQPRS